MNVLIVDDEPKAREGLQRLLQHYAPEIKTIHQAENVAGAVEQIRSHQPSVVFLDIEMPNGSGFDLFNTFPEPDFKVVFVTAYEQYAIQAFKVSALDYLLKPIDPEELVDCLQKIKERLGNTENSTDRLRSLISHLKQTDLKKLALPDMNGVTFLNVDEIVHCSSDRNYTKIHCSDGKTHLISKTLKEIEGTLAPFNFFRVHHSDLINLNYVSRYDKLDGGYAVMKDGSRIAVSKRKRAAFLKVLGL